MKKEKSKKIILYSISGNFIIFIVKIIAFILSGSPSMLAESVHSLVDTGNQACLLIGNFISKRKPTRESPLGGGIGQYLWNLIAAIGIFFFGAGITLYHGISSIFQPSVKHGGLEISLIILFISLLIEGSILIKALDSVKKAKGKKTWIHFFKNCEDPTILGIVLEDSIAVSSIILAFFGILISHFTGNQLFDSITSILIGILLGLMALILFQLNSRLILGAALSVEQENKIKKFLESCDGVDKVVRLSTHIIGPEKYSLEAEIELDPTEILDPEQMKWDSLEIKENPDKTTQILVDVADRSYRKVGKITDELEEKIKNKFPKILLIRIEIN